MSDCTSCGSPIPDGQGSSCSMCYGDMGYGSDGYYEAWAAEEMRQEELKEEEIRQYQEELRMEEVERMTEFKECPECAKKPGSPILCPTCIMRRSLIENTPNQDDIERGCKYCNDGYNIFEFEELSDDLLIFGGDIAKDNAIYIERGVFIDRGWLRLVDLDDCGCMDHGERVKLGFCPFCGKEFKDR